MYHFELPLDSITSSLEDLITALKSDSHVSTVFSSLYCQSQDSVIRTLNLFNRVRLSGSPWPYGTWLDSCVFNLAVCVCSHTCTLWFIPPDLWLVSQTL